MVLFPFIDALNEWPFKGQPSTARAAAIQRRLRRSYYEWEWEKRFNSYNIKAVNSRYTKKWTQKRWGIDCEVVYPPIDKPFYNDAKSDVILSVGRFSLKGVNKRQLEMATIFQRIADEDLRGWQFYCVGGVGASASDQAYFEDVRRVGAAPGLHVLADIERCRLRQLYGQAKIFWHAAGYGEDENLHPQRREHFGIVTVEAMAAGCVPIVINGGGQSEIVEHGVNGFLWNSLDELADYTIQLRCDDGLRARMSNEARARSQHFGRAKFIEQFKTLLQPFLRESP